MEDILNKRKEDIKKLITDNKNYIIYSLLLIIIGIATKIRTSNIPLLKNPVTSNYIPNGPDDLAIYRYAQYTLDHGQLMANDILRYVPYGYDPRTEFGFFSNLLAYSYKIISMIFSNITFDYYFILFPVFSFIIFLIVYYFLVKNLFDEKIAILSSAIVGVATPLIFRTMSGATDKESLALTTMTIAMLFYVLAWKGKTMKFSLLLAILAGFFTAITATVWGGVVFIYMILGATAFILLLLDQFTEKDRAIYVTWWIMSVLSLYLLFSTRLPIKSFIFSSTTLITNFTFFFCIIDYLVNKQTIIKKKELITKIPRPILSIIITILILLTLILIVKGPAYFSDKINSDFYLTLANPEGEGRWGTTVAEASETYIKNWFGYFRTLPFILFILGSILLFGESIKKIKKYNKILWITYSLLLISLLISKYSKDTILDGESLISKVLLFGSIAIFLVTFISLYLYTYYKNKEEHKLITELNKPFILTTIWLLIMIIVAKSKIRLVMMLVPVIAIFISYALFYIYQLIKKIKDIKLKTVSYILLFFIIFSPFASAVNSIPIIKNIPIINTDGFLTAMTKTTFIVAQTLRPDSGTARLKALNWIKHNTPENSVFASWWDYGYEIQTLGERATISDNGNIRGGINYFTGRYLLTSNNDTETLEFLYANNVTHILIPSEIEKYLAYALIGSDINYDRYTAILNFKLDPKRSQKQGNFNYLYYVGGFKLDKDYEYQGTKIPFKNSEIAAIIVPITQTKEQIKIEQPKAVIRLQGNSEALMVPIECVFFENKKVKYPEKGFDSCIVIIPSITNTMNSVGSLLYISEKAVDGFFARYYLFNEKNNNFELVYNDEEKSPFLEINSKTQGPIKIWKVNYPKNIKDNPFYRQTALPDERLYYINPELEI